MSEALSTGAHGAPVLTIRNLSKTFGGAHALRNVDLTIRPGEVHGLLGQNGSGKSTLIKVLAGYHDPDPEGRLEIFGSPVKLPLVPGEFRKLGMAFVHQHLGLVPSLSVLENLRIGAFATEAMWRIDWRAERRRCLQTFKKFNLDIDPDIKVGALPQVTRALVAIVRAIEEIRLNQSLHGGEGILILDEPTPFLPRAGIDQLFDLVREVVKGGASVVFVSHDVDEIMEITDRATVLRDGQVVGTLETEGSSPEDFVELIIGRKVTPFHIQHESMTSRPAEISIKALTGGSLRNVDIDLHHGEVVGLTGLIGSGFNEVPYLVYGAVAADAGRLTMTEDQFDLAAMSPLRAQEAGLALLPADRLGAAGVGGLPIVDNITLPALERFTHVWGLNRRAMSAWAKFLGAEHDVRPNRPELNLDALSGGNQQKVLLGKWLQTGPRLLLLDEPTQGVDVGARQQVYMAIDKALSEGMSVLCASTDYEQLEQICDRVLVFSHGGVAHELVGGMVAKERIAEACYQGLGPNHHGAGNLQGENTQTSPVTDIASIGNRER